MQGFARKLMKNRFAKRTLSLILTLCMCLTGIVAFSSVPAEAKAKPKLSSKSVMIAMGGKQKIKLKNGKGKWTIRNDGVATITKRTKKYVVVKPLKAGQTVVTCKVGKKKLKCKVRVVNNIIGNPKEDLGYACVVGDSTDIGINLKNGLTVNDIQFDSSVGQVTRETVNDPKKGYPVEHLHITALRPGRFRLDVVTSDPAKSGYINFAFINGFRGKAKVKKTDANYKKWRKNTINTMVSADMSTWEIINAVGTLISTGKYGLKGGASGKQLWYGGNGTCVSGAKMMNDFMKDLGITSKVHFAGNSGGNTDIFGYTIFYASAHKNTWFTLGGVKWEVNPQPGMTWPAGTVKR